MKFSDYIDKIKFTLIIMPEGSRSLVKNKNYKFFRALRIIGVFSFILFAVFYLLFSYTPLKATLEFGDSMDVRSGEIVSEMNDRLEVLILQLDSLREKNRRLQNILLNNDRKPVQDKADKEGKNKENNLGAILIELYNSIFTGPKPSFFSPVTGFISQKFLPEKGHFGIDLVISENTPVMASANGYVVFSDFTLNDGNTIILAHAAGYITVYKHCSAVLKKERDLVEQGEVIALSGNSGKHTSGPHLHFEIWKDGVPLDPSDVLSK